MSLWQFTVKHDLWIYNSFPTRESVIVDMERILINHIQTIITYFALMFEDLLVFLELKLKNDHNLLKWNQSYFIDQFLRFSDEHSYIVSNIQTLFTGYMSSQYQLVFDDSFETFISTRNDKSVFGAICNDLFELNRDWYAKDEHYDTGKLIN